MTVLTGPNQTTAVRVLHVPQRARTHTADHRIQVRLVPLPPDVWRSRLPLTAKIFFFVWIGIANDVRPKNEYTAKSDDDNENDGHDQEFRVERDEISLLARLRIIRLLVVIYLFRFCR